MKNKIYQCLWFEGNAKEAAEFYIKTFGDGKIMVDTPMVVNFELSGQKFMGLNGGPEFTPTPATSFMVVLENEKELEKIWSQLTDGGSILMPLDKYDWSEKYGWVLDQFGISWQLMLGNLKDVHGQKFVPTLMFSGKNQGKAEEAMNFYVSLFNNTSIDGVMPYESGEMKGQVNHAQFKLENQVFALMDSGIPQNFTFTEGISNIIEANTQDEIDHFWNAFAKTERQVCADGCKINLAFGGRYSRQLWKKRW